MAIPETYNNRIKIKKQEANTELIVLAIGSGMITVEFYVDNILKSMDRTAPYSWKCNEQIICKHTIKTVSYDHAGNTKNEEKIVWVFNR